MSTHLRAVAVALLWLAMAAGQDAPPRRTFEVTEPLYDELLTDQPYGLARDGVIYWSFGRTAYELRPFALQYGQRYVVSEMLDVFAAHHLMVLDNPYTFTTDVFDMVGEHRRRGTKGIIAPGLKDTVADPDVRAAYLDAVGQILRDHGDLIWGIYAGDEELEHQLRLLPQRLAEKPEDSLVRRVDAEVKEHYGFGKHGLPKPDEDDPFKRIAYHRWVDDQLQRLAEDLRALRDAVAPGVKLISWDPVAQLQGTDYGRWNEVFDVVTHQLYPSRDPNRCEFGFITKVLVDLTSRDGGRSPGPEVWPCTHVEHYAGAFTPDEVNEYLSQVFRNGGLGLHLYLADTIGRRAGKGNTWFDYYGSPPRWNTIMQVVDRLRTDRRPKRPPFPPAAILLSSDTMNAGPGWGTRPDEAEALYTFLGPQLHRGFLFVSDRQVERGDRVLGDFRAVLVPKLVYLTHELADKLYAYVRQGGFVVMFDPEAMRFYTDGTSAADARERICGVKLGEPSEAKQLADEEGTVITLLSQAWRLQPVGAAEAVLQFDTGDPAVIFKPVGQGQVINCAFNPLSFKALGNAVWQTQMGRLADMVSPEQVDLWRLKLPDPADVTPPPEPGTCLTGNYLRWDNNEPLDVQNASIAGSYTYSLAPDAWPDEGGTTDVPLASGDLTDRRSAPTAGDCFVEDKEKRAQNPPVTAWAVRWKDTAAFDVTFDLLEPRTFDRVSVWFSGEQPALAVSGSDDAQTWAELGRAAAVLDTLDVQSVVVSGQQGKHRYVRLHFDARHEGKTLTLAEVELWGTP